MSSLTLPKNCSFIVVKECVHIETNKYYACKVISKRLMAGREGMVRNEIAVLKKISQGHPNVLTLIDYFETTNNLYLVFDLCTGGELFDRICAKGCKCCLSYPAKSRKNITNISRDFLCISQLCKCLL